MQVKDKFPHGKDAALRARVAILFRELLAKLGYSQSQMATALGVSQGQVSKWLGEKQTPPGQVFAAVARMAPEEDRDTWLELAGLKKAEIPSKATVEIPLLRDAAAAGTPRAIDEREIASLFDLPKAMLPRGGQLQAVRIEGDSMSPVLLDGHIVIIDLTKRDPSKLVLQMVAARDDEGGVTIKWLRYSGGIYSLVPQHTAPEYEVRYLKPHGEFTIIGQIVKWIGEPPPPPKKR